MVIEKHGSLIRLVDVKKKLKLMMLLDDVINSVNAVGMCYKNRAKKWLKRTNSDQEHIR